MGGGVSEEGGERGKKGGMGSGGSEGKKKEKGGEKVLQGPCKNCPETFSKTKKQARAMGHYELVSKYKFLHHWQVDIYNSLF